VSVHADVNGIHRVRVDEAELTAELLSVTEDTALLSLEGAHVSVRFWRHPSGRLHLALPTRNLDLIDSAVLATAGEEAAGDGVVTAPMHGQLLEILVCAGETVARGDKLAVLEAMKMQHEILAEVDGVVAEVVAEAGVQIAAGDRILEIEETAKDAGEK
jgi:geranyl-CoA carboxylase alpha subunit